MKKALIHKLFNVILIFLLSSILVKSQYALKPKDLGITLSQSIHFGTFCLLGTSDGEITLDHNGQISSKGGIYLLQKLPVSQVAIFEIVTCKLKNINISFDSSTRLTGNNGGSFILDIGPTDKGTNGLIIRTNGDCNEIIYLKVGGTLHIPKNSPSGVYSGSFDITINKE